MCMQKCRVTKKTKQKEKKKEGEKQPRRKFFPSSQILRTFIPMYSRDPYRNFWTYIFPFVYPISASLVEKCVLVAIFPLRLHSSVVYQGIMIDTLTLGFNRLDWSSQSPRTTQIIDSGMHHFFGKLDMFCLIFSINLGV